jgi:spore maturation protein CgeB
MKFNAKSAAKIFLNRRANRSIHVRSIKEMITGSRALFSHRRPQIKGRTFEIPGYGGFLLSETADDLERYYRPGEEIGTFADADELVEKVHYYLGHDEERSHIRENGYRRTISEHTYEARFRQIFDAMGIGQSRGSP